MAAPKAAALPLGDSPAVDFYNLEPRLRLPHAIKGLIILDRNSLPSDAIITQKECFDILDD